jgi:hypothetical protein
MSDSTPLIEETCVRKALSVATPPTHNSQSLEPEPWVDLRALAEHIGFCQGATRRMVEEDKIPGKPFVNGKKTFWRFQLSAVDAAFSQSAGERQ